MNWKEYVADMRGKVKAVHAAAPGTGKGFIQMSKAAKEEGPLDPKVKEFVALGISVGVRCEPCIGFHIEALVKLGATREEVADVLGMAFQTGGGPGLMYAAKALDCYDSLTS